MNGDDDVTYVILDGVEVAESATPLVASAGTKRKTPSDNDDERESAHEEPKIARVLMALKSTPPSARPPSPTPAPAPPVPALAAPTTERPAFVPVTMNYGHQDPQKGWAYDLKTAKLGTFVQFPTSIKDGDVVTFEFGRIDKPIPCTFANGFPAADISTGATGCFLPRAKNAKLFDSACFKDLYRVETIPRKLAINGHVVVEISQCLTRLLHEVNAWRASPAKRPARAPCLDPMHAHCMRTLQPLIRTMITEALAGSSARDRLTDAVKTAEATMARCPCPKNARILQLHTDALKAEFQKPLAFAEAYDSITEAVKESFRSVATEVARAQVAAGPWGRRQGKGGVLEAEGRRTYCEDDTPLCALQRRGVRGKLVTHCIFHSSDTVKRQCDEQHAPPLLYFLASVLSSHMLPIAYRRDLSSLRDEYVKSYDDRALLEGMRRLDEITSGSVHVPWKVWVKAVVFMTIASGPRDELSNNIRPITVSLRLWDVRYIDTAVKLGNKLLLAGGGLGRCQDVPPLREMYDFFNALETARSMADIDAYDPPFRFGRRRPEETTV